MTTARHKKTSSLSRRVALVVSGVGVAALTLGVLGAAASPETARPRPSGELVASLSELPRETQVVISRSGGREEKAAQPESPAPEAAGAGAVERDPSEVAVEQQWLTEDLNVWTGPGEGYTLLEVLPTGSKVRATGEVDNGYAEIVHDGRFAWVNADYLASDKPEPETEEDEDTTSAPGPLSGAPCPDGSSIESGLTSSAIELYRAACAAFPEVSSWGGYRAGDDGYHGSGQAVDIMATGALGDAIADWAVAHADELGVVEILWAQQIWTAERSSEGWRTFSDRGSTTANHYDHVHVAVY